MTELRWRMLKKASAILIVAIQLIAITGCLELETPPRTVQLAPPLWLQGTWCCAFDLACFDISSTDIIWRRPEGNSFSVRYDFGSVTDSAPTDQYYVVYLDGAKWFSFTMLGEHLINVWQKGMDDTMLYTRE